MADRLCPTYTPFPDMSIAVTEVLYYVLSGRAVPHHGVTYIRASRDPTRAVCTLNIIYTMEMAIVDVIQLHQLN